MMPISVSMTTTSCLHVRNTIVFRHLVTTDTSQPMSVRIPKGSPTKTSLLLISLRLGLGDRRPTPIIRNTQPSATTGTSGAPVPPTPQPAPPPLPQTAAKSILTFQGKISPLIQPLSPNGPTLWEELGAGPLRQYMSAFEVLCVDCSDPAIERSEHGQHVKDDQWNAAYGHVPRRIFRIVDETVKLMKDQQKDNLRRVLFDFPSPLGNTVGHIVSRSKQQYHDMILIFFMNPYRGAIAKFGISSWQRADCRNGVVDDIVRGVVDDVVRRIFVWLDFVGRIFCCVRMFTRLGVDLLDSSMRLSYKRLRNTGSYGLTLVLSAQDPVNPTPPLWNVSEQVSRNLSGCNMLARNWINEKHRISTGDAFFPEAERHIYIRPGWSIDSVNMAEINYRQGLPEPSLSQPVERAPRSLYVSMNRITALWRLKHTPSRDKKGGGKGSRPRMSSSATAFRNLCEVMSPHSITFLDRRQIPWQTKSQGKNAHFDSHRMEYLLMFIFHGLGEKVTGNDDYIHPALPFPSHLDFGAYIPVNLDGLHPTFMPVHTLPALTSICLPYVQLDSNWRQKDKPYTATLLLDSNWGLTPSISDKRRPLTVVISMKAEKERQSLSADIQMMFFNKMPVWWYQMKARGASARAMIPWRTHKTEMVKVKTPDGKVFEERLQGMIDMLKSQVLIWDTEKEKEMTAFWEPLNLDWNAGDMVKDFMSELLHSIVPIARTARAGTKIAI